MLRTSVVIAVLAATAASPTFGTSVRRAARGAWSYDRCDDQFGPHRWPMVTGKCLIMHY